ncbi:TetR/AcrR family transcriptional regulator [Cryptosporangium phraense]|uniref:TetR/AcrR family transcriptional regulator n=1 Tax=Cryptosporangium phraense TaxID=2593070 RepID=A0A545AP49_9ACTN|nr:TetR/AcrR family transcriptional regulator [Cryptosporangium phraense]TQS43031.1 TetR/AcrR family transcriptional regulator [Cryptosporangium phraense]
MTDRQAHVLEIALATFARYGYRKTSMDDVARAADISRPGLYFLWASKQSLFRAAVVHALDGDLAAVERILADADRPLRDRLIAAFDAWTGRYVGPMAQEIAVLIDTSPELLGPIADDYPKRFLSLLSDAVPDDVARTLRSTAIGIKQEAATRAEFVERMTIAVDLIVTPPAGRAARGR